MKVEIQVQGGTVTITVGGSSASAGRTGTITSQGIVGGDPATESTKSGGGTNGYGYGALVIGPIVVDCCGSQAAYEQPNSTGGDPATESTKSGGDPATESTKSGGDPATESTKSGGAGLSSGTVVIGPIVVGGCYGGGSGGASQGSDDSPSQAISVMPK